MDKNFYLNAAYICGAGGQTINSNSKETRSICVSA